MPRKPPALPITTDEDIERVLAAFSRLVFRQVFDAADRASLLAEICMRFSPVAIYCKHAREGRGESLKSAARALRVPQYVLKQVEEGDVLEIEWSLVARYVEHLGFEDWFATWIDSNRRLVAILLQPPAIRATLRTTQVDELVAALESHRPAARRSAPREAPKSSSRGPSAPAGPVADGQALQLEICLEGLLPPIWRRVLISADSTLHQLHRAVQQAMGWEDRHLYAFKIGEDLYSDPSLWDDRPRELKDGRKAKLRDLGLVEGAVFQYQYDFADGWDHSIAVERAGEASIRRRLPACLAGERACPPEDSGGPHGYEEKLAALADPKHPDHRDIRDWLPQGFDPEAFDIDEVNRRLQRSGGGNRRRTPLEVN